MDWKHIATLSKEEQARALVENWKRVGPELERIKRDELRGLDDEEGVRRALRVMDSRPPVAVGLRKPRPLSGLIQQQELFRKGRTRT